MAIKNALQFVSRWLARTRKGPGEQVSSGAGGSAAEPSTLDDVLETIGQCLLMYALWRLCGPNGRMVQFHVIFDECQKEGKEVKEARDLPE